MKKYWEAIKKDLWVVLLDIVAVNLAFFLALIIRFFVNGMLRPIAVSRYMPAYLGFAPWYTVLCIIIFMAFRLYGGLWRYAGINDMNRIILATLCTTVVYITGTCLFFTRMPISYYLIGMVLQFFFVVSIRFGYRVLLVEKKKIRSRNSGRINCVVIGSGENGRRVIKNLEETENYRPTAVVGNEKGTMDGIPIVDIESVEWKRIGAVFIADSLLSSSLRSEIKKKTEEAGIEFHDYTGYISNLGGRLSLTELLAVISGPVTLDINGVERCFPSGEEAIQSFTKQYDVKGLEGKIKIKLVDHQKLSTQDTLKAAYAAVMGEEAGDQK